MCGLIPDKPHKFKYPDSVKYSIDILTQNLALNLISIHKGIYRTISVISTAISQWIC